MFHQIDGSDKGTEDVKPMFVNAMMTADKKPATLISDGAANFHDA